MHPVSFFAESGAVRCHYFTANDERKMQRIGVRSQLTVGFLFTFIFYSSFIQISIGLTAEERSELARKFKYYHNSVRPNERYNLVESVNGTFFALHGEVELLKCRPTGDRIDLEFALILHYNDERLLLRDLSEVIRMPEEFVPWRPEIEYPEGTHRRSMIHLDPRTGHLSLREKLSISLQCRFSDWTIPFHVFECHFPILTTDDERIFLRHLSWIPSEVECSIDQWPLFALRCQFRNHWPSALVKIYLPSLFVFIVVVFAQWKRRKMQILVTLGGLVSLILFITAFRTNGIFTMLDLWMMGTLFHMICLLSIDLILPARRLIRTTYSTINGNESSSNNSECGYFGRSKRYVTTSYRDASERLLRPAITNRAFTASSDMSPMFVEVANNKSAHENLNVEMVDDEEDEEDQDTRQMRTTFVHVTTHSHSPFRSHSASPSTQLRRSSVATNKSPQPSATPTASPTATATAAIVRRRPLPLTSQTQRFVTRMTIGRKKRAALIAIVGCYALFSFGYLLLVVYVLL